jgi:hypothetical protein
MPTYYSEPISSSTISDNKIINNRIFTNELSNNEEFLTPDLLRLAGIQSSSPDDGYETNSSPILNSNCDSRFFPISTNRHDVYSNKMSNQVCDSFLSTTYYVFLLTVYLFYSLF